VWLGTHSSRALPTNWFSKKKGLLWPNSGAFGFQAQLGLWGGGGQTYIYTNFFGDQNWNVPRIFGGLGGKLGGWRLHGVFLERVQGSQCPTVYGAPANSHWRVLHAQRQEALDLAVEGTGDLVSTEHYNA
jgi:hypothetical protein